MRIRRVDANQREVVKALRKAGAEVTFIHTLGKGVPDLLVSFRNVWSVMEVKDGSKPPSARELTPDEKEWIAKQKALVAIINSPEEAVRFITA
jgi:phosphopantothenoylcysteine synthetase/decarboxylase